MNLFSYFYLYKDRIQLQILGSATQYPGAVASEFNQKRGKFNDCFIAVGYNQKARNWSWSLDFDDFDSESRAVLGFIPIVGYRNLEGGVNYSWIGKSEGWWCHPGGYSELNFCENEADGLLQKSSSLGVN